jgi:methionyl-tRNA synthetase
VDRGVLAATATGFTEVGDAIGRHRQRAGIVAAMRTVGEVNKYLAVTTPWKLAKGDEADRARMGTVLHVAAQAVSDCNRLLAPYLPHAAQAVDRVLGFDRPFGDVPVIEEVTDLEDSTRHYPIITGDYSGSPAWASEPVLAGQAIPAPVPVFTKLDDSIVAAELERLRGEH